MTHSPATQSRSPCPIASSLDLIGDRWTLVLLRDMINGKKRFAEFLASPERITTNVLAGRLSAMEEAGLVEKRPYHQRPIRYEYLPTKKGYALLPILQGLCIWANTYLPGTWTAPESFMRREIG